MAFLVLSLNFLTRLPASSFALTLRILRLKLADGVTTRLKLYRPLLSGLAKADGDNELANNCWEKSIWVWYGLARSSLF